LESPVSKELTLILGGARSGKSSYAEQLAAQFATQFAVGRGERVLYVATAQAWDDEMRERITKHQAQRPAHWQTLEAPTQVGEAIAAAQAAVDGGWDVVLVDCLTLLANNVLMTLPEPVETAEAEAALQAEVNALLTTYQASSARWILVSNEVGLGIVPAYPLGRVYRDALGRANQQLAAAATKVLFMVAGLPMRVK
jgi:adenosylcobinamide kinase/adenosylcobinamide-phosphate guanylyltransferase